MRNIFSGKFFYFTYKTNSTMTGSKNIFIILGSLLTTGYMSSGCTENIILSVFCVEYSNKILTCRCGVLQSLQQNVCCYCQCTSGREMF